MASQMLNKTHLIIDLDSIKWKLTETVLKIGAASERTGCKIEITHVHDCNLIKKSAHTLELLIQTSPGSNLTVGRHREEYIKIIYTETVKGLSQTALIGKRPRHCNNNGIYSEGAKKLKLIDEDNKIILNKQISTVSDLSGHYDVPEDSMSYTMVLINDHRTHNKPLLVDATIKITDQDEESEEDNESDEELASEKFAYLSDISDLIDDEDEESRESDESGEELSNSSDSNDADN